MMDRGFELMIPKEKKESIEQKFDYVIKFTLFNREFCLSFKVNRKE